MAAQQLFERVELRGEGELGKIQALLDDALDRRIKEVAAGELNEKDELELRAASADFIGELRQLVVFAADASEGGAAASAPTVPARTQLTPVAGGASLSLALRSPMLPPLSPPPADAEVAALEAEVTEAALRVAELRTSMQARLQEQLAAKLAACRPSAELEPAAVASRVDAAGAADVGALEQQQQQHVRGPDGAAGAGAQQEVGACREQQLQAMDTDGAAAAADPEVAAGQQLQEQQAAAAQAAAPIPLSPQPEELQQRLLAAANRLPTLRARLEAATDRLQRVVVAVSADINRPPPNTVEKAVLGKTPGKPSAAAAADGSGAGAEGAENAEPRVSPLVQQALESGQISTRRRVGRDVQPVPFSQPE